MVDEEFFRDRLRFFRNKKQVSAREMSLALGQNESYINKIETGKTSTTIASFLNICDYLAVSPADFFNEVAPSNGGISELNRYFCRLSPRQSNYMLEFLKDLSEGNESRDDSSCRPVSSRSS